MRILILGGGKFQGRVAAERLVAQGHDVVLFNHASVGIVGARHIQGERGDTDALRQLILEQDYDCLIDNLAYSRDDVEGLLPLMHERVGHYVLISSFVVYGHTPELGMVREEDAPLDSMSGSQYDIGKRQCELALMESEISTSWSILRFSNIDGPGDHSNRRGFFIDRVADGAGLLIPGDYVHPFRPLWRDDAAAAVVMAATCARARSKVYNIAGREIMTVNEWVNLIAELMDRPKPFVVQLPFDDIRHLVGYDYRLPLPGRPLLDISLVETELGFEASPVRSWLPETIRWWREAGLTSRFWETRALEIEAIEKIRMLIKIGRG